MGLELILEYNMSDMEAKALKLCLIWEKVMQNECPNYRAHRLPAGDPRKSLLFRTCHTLLRKTTGIIKDEDYKFYILAQVRALKNVSDGKLHALITPACLVGPGAWNRWKIWQVKIEKALKNNLQAAPQEAIAEKAAIIGDLNKNKKFLEDKKALGKRLFIQNMKNLSNWLGTGKLSPYFIILYNLETQTWKSLEDKFSFDPEVYEKEINDPLRVWFKQNFQAIL